MVKYQGPVPQGASVKKFRDTGKTVVVKNGKEILYKDYKKENKKKGEKNKSSNIISKLKQQISNKNILKKSPQVVAEISERNAEYIPTYFKKEMEETKKSLFFS